MKELKNTLNTLKQLQDGSYYYSLPALENQGLPVRRLPVSLRILLESLLRNCDGVFIQEKEIQKLASWNAKAPSDADLPFIVSRVLLQDFTGVPLLVDLAMMRDKVFAKGSDPTSVEPQVPVDLVIDHSVQVDRSGTDDAFVFNLKTEIKRNAERYSFLKWGQEAFKSFKVVPPGIGIVHQVNLEHLATVVTEEEQEDGTKLLYPDTLVGTDSHTTMINGLGVLGWGVGGIEAEAAMLNQPVFLQTPEVIGVHLTGQLKEGVTATDLTLRVTELLRKAKVVNKFVEFFGEGVEALSVADRATIANMAPEYGATMGFFPVDQKTLDYLKLTGRTDSHIQQVKDYCIAQNLYGVPKKGEIEYTQELELDLSTISPCVSGPKRPQDRVELSQLKEKFRQLLSAPKAEGGYEKTDNPKVLVHAGGPFTKSEPHTTGGTNALEPATPLYEAEMVANRPVTEAITDPGYMEGIHCDVALTHGSIAIAAITSCTNTSNPYVMLGAGILAKKACERGLTVNKTIKTSLAPGSRVVTDYLERTDLQRYLNQLGFHLVAYGCTTCIGNSGPLEEHIEKAIKDNDLISVSVLSGNRNFEARINSTIKANFLMSPPLVVAFAIAGRIDVDMDRDPLGYDKEGNPVFLREIWPSSQEIQEALNAGLSPETFRERYNDIYTENPLWDEIDSPKAPCYPWEPSSTYIQSPPFIPSSIPTSEPKVWKEMRALALFGDSVTTDHISPAGSFRKDSPAGKFLISMGVQEADFNSYGSRRGNFEVMARGTFANVRIRNKMVDREGGYTKLQPDAIEMPIFDAAQTYIQRNVPLIIFAGKDYGMGSSRDWAAKGAFLLGVKAVVAQSFERIHRSNLIGMGVLPLQFQEGESLENLGITGKESFSLDLNNIFTTKVVELEICDGTNRRKINLISRLDTPSEIAYFKNGGILPFIYQKMIAQ